MHAARTAEMALTSQPYCSTASRPSSTVGEARGPRHHTVAPERERSTAPELMRKRAGHTLEGYVRDSLKE